MAEGTATITVTAQDADGNRVSDTFEVSVVEIPGPVINLQLSATSDSVTVSWQAPESGGTPQRYIVYLKEEGGKKGSGKTKTPQGQEDVRDLQEPGGRSHLQGLGACPEQRR